MSRRYYMTRFECGHPGCREVANYEPHTRDEQTRLFRQYGNGQWRCIRHERMDELLTPSNLRRVVEVKSERKFTDGGHDIGLYWGSNGFVFGPGFKVFSKDFPEGTVLRVTAEVIPPDAANGPYGGKP